MKRLQRGIAGILILSLLLTGCIGCGAQEEQNKSVVSVARDDFTGMCGTEYVSLVGTLTQLPGVLVNQNGYDTAADKYVYFHGSRLGRYYFICDAETGEVVYTGMIENVQPIGDTQKQIGYGTFTELQTEGSYYIRTDYIGESYYFEIRLERSETLYENMLLAYEALFLEDTAEVSSGTDYEAGAQADQAAGTGAASETTSEITSESDSGSDLGSGAESNTGSGYYTAGSLYEHAAIIAELILSYRLYPEIFTDDLSQLSRGNGIPDLLDIIKIYTDWVLDLQIDTIEGEDLASYAGILAEFSQIYKEFDNSYASKCRQAAEGVYYRLLTEMETAEQESVYFYAIVQLYLVSGYNRYHQTVKTILSDETGITGDENFRLLGWIGYLSGKKGVDISLCSQIMEQLMNHCEEISLDSKENAWRVCDTDVTQMLQKLQYLSIMDYAVSSQEYRTILEYHYHYLMGCNPDAVNYVELISKTDLNEDPAQIQQGTLQSAMLLLIMSEIAESGL